MGIGHGPIVCRHDARDDITMLFFFKKVQFVEGIKDKHKHFSKK